MAIPKRKDPSRIAALDELWRRGHIDDLLLHDGQKYITEKFSVISSHKVVVLNISRQWGKTYWAVVQALKLAFGHKKSNIRIGAAFETDLMEFIEPAFEAALETCPDPLRPKYNQQKKRYTFHNGSRIKLVGLDKKPNGMRGNTVDLIIIDEAGFVGRLRYLYESVIVPLMTHRPEAVVIMLSTPPESPDHEFWEFVDQAIADGSYAHFTIDENPLLSAKDIAVIESRYPGGRNNTSFQREYLGKRIIDETRAIIPEWRSELIYSHDVRADTRYRFWHKYEHMDIGVQVDKTICLFGFYNFAESCLYIESEVDVSGAKTTTDLIEKTIVDKEREIGYQFPYRRIADNSHPLLINDLAIRPEGLVFMQTDKGKLHEMVGELRVWVRMGRIKVHESCKQLLGCLSSGIWNRQRTEFERSKVFGHYDALAALIYGVRNTDQWTNPIPDWFINPDRMPVAGRDRSGLSPSGRALRDAFSK